MTGGVLHRPGLTFRKKNANLPGPRFFDNTPSTRKGVITMSRLGIVVFAFGTPATINSNCLLADIARLWSNQKSAPIFTQADIKFPPSFTGSVTYCDESTNHPPPTLKIAQEALAWATTQGLDELCIVAAEPHFTRCLRDLRVARRERRASVRLIRAFPPNSIESENWFCPDSASPRTRDASRWQLTERVLNLLPVWLYKIVARIYS